MVLGRRELGAILLGAAAIVFYLVLLSTAPSRAQTGGGTTVARTTNQNQYDTQDRTTSNRTTSNRTTTPQTTRERKPQTERTVINVPNKPLPPSGGLAVYGVIAGSVLAGAGLLALGLGIHRGPQR